jgi:hypothetical protein
MAEPQGGDQRSIQQIIDSDALAIGRKVLGRDLTPDEAEALTTIFQAAAQALSAGFIQRLARHVVAERGEESIEQFFEGQVKAD